MTNAAASPRSWLRPHTSTICFSFLVVGAFILINIPGDATGILSREHGWPLRYLNREQDYPPTPPNTICVLRVYSPPNTWTVTEGVVAFYPGYLIINAGVALAAGLLCAVAFEWWRRRHRHLLQFSLRSALIGMVVCSLCFAWFGQRVMHARQQRATVARLEGLIAHVEYESRLPDWIRDLISDDVALSFDDVHSVSMSGGMEFSDDDLHSLSMLTTIRTLYFEGNLLSDADLAQIAQLKNVVELTIENCEITDEGLKHLAQLSRLRSLNLNGTRIRGPGLRHLHGLKQLETLSLCNTELNDAGLNNLVDLPKLHQVSVVGNKVTSAGAERFTSNSLLHAECQMESVGFGGGGGVGFGGGPFGGSGRFGQFQAPGTDEAAVTRGEELRVVPAH